MGQDYVSEFARTAAMAAQLDSGPPFPRACASALGSSTQYQTKPLTHLVKRRRPVTTRGGIDTHTHIHHHFNSSYKMVCEEHDPDSDRRRPRAFGLADGSDGEGLDGDDGDDDDDDVGGSGGDGSSDEEEIEIPPDPSHEARMAILREQNAQLLAVVDAQEVVLSQMAERTREIQQATAQRQEELNQLRAAREQREQAQQQQQPQAGLGEGGAAQAVHAVNEEVAAQAAGPLDTQQANGSQKKL